MRAYKRQLNRKERKGREGGAKRRILNHEDPARPLGRNQSGDDSLNNLQRWIVSDEEINAETRRRREKTQEVDCKSCGGLEFAGPDPNRRTQFRVLLLRAYGDMFGIASGLESPKLCVFASLRFLFSFFSQTQRK